MLNIRCGALSLAIVGMSMVGCKRQSQPAAIQPPVRTVVHAEPKPYPDAFPDEVTSLQRGDFIIECILAYRSDTGEYPEALADLVPTYIESIPKPIANYRKWGYQRAADGFSFTLGFGENETMYPGAMWDSTRGSWRFDE